MLLTAQYLPPKTLANSAATFANCAAVALTGLPAAIVPFQWHQASHSLHKNVNSAPSPLLPAGQFGGNNANCATNAKFAAF